ncbi:MAG: dTDP-4-dehydrorhamnose reductase [Litoreibacter sp.]
MKILVFGKTGQVSLALARQAEVISVGRDMADLENADRCAEVIHQFAPDAVINAAAYTAVDKAETEVESAYKINAHAPASMAVAAAALDIPLVHISTDYVFDGSGTKSRAETDEINPLQIYGKSKREGEVNVQAANGRYAILRTSWVFSRDGANFVKTMLRLGADRDALSIVGDQVGGPTPADAIAAACLTMATDLVADKTKSGIYHFSGSEDVSWADFATAIFEAAGMDVAVTAIPSKDYPTPATRPLNSRLDCALIKEVFGIERPDWRAAVAKIV